MGRPIKKEFIGSAEFSESKKLIIDSAFIPGAKSASSNVTILSQKGTGVYIVTDGTNTGKVRLVDGSAELKEGEAISIAKINQGTVTSTVYQTNTVTLNGKGSGYAVNDHLVIPNVVDITVKTVDDKGAITSVSQVISVKTSETNMAADGVAANGGTGTGATFNVTSKEVPVETSNIVTEHSRVIFNRTVSTFEGGNYPWSLDGDTAIGSATLSTQ